MTPTRRRLSIAMLSVVAIAALSGCGTAGPTGTPTSTSAAPASAEPAGTPAPCGRGDVRATSTGWGAAAGSRGSDVTVENVGAAACVLPPVPMVAFLDATSEAILQNPPRTGGALLTLDPGDAATFSFVASNWCDTSVNTPVIVSLVLATEVAAIEGVPIDSVDDMPPCMGEEQQPTLSTTDWQAA